ncbi:hypothetical protein Tco_0246492 [Tanacetum coccineum]
MSTLTFANTHNMVAFFEKPAESDGFHEIIDFLNTNLIRYALTVNPTIYTSCIEQFWATAKAKTVNDERGTDCLPTATIFEELTRMRITPLFVTMMVQPNQEEGVDSGIPNDHHQTPVTTQPSSSRSQKKQTRRKLRKDTTMLKRKKKSKTTGFKRLRKVGMSKRVESSKDKDSLGDHEDASKQGRSIEDSDKDVDVSLVNDTQGTSDEAEMFDTNKLHGDEVVVDMLVGEKQEQSAKEREVNTSVKDSDAPTTIEEITLAQALIQIKAAKPKVVTTAATTTTTTRPKARGVVVQEPIPLKRKDQVALDEDLARNLQAQLEAELIEEERLHKLYVMITDEEN